MSWPTASREQQLRLPGRVNQQAIFVQTEHMDFVATEVGCEKERSCRVDDDLVDEWDDGLSGICASWGIESKGVTLYKYKV